MSRQLLSLFLMLLELILTDGCRVVRISDNRPPSNGSPRTTYSLTDMTSFERPVYKSDTSDMYLYYISESDGKWVVGGTVGALDGYIMYVTDNHFNADEITGTFFTKQNGWVESAEVSVSCTVENVALGKPASQSSTNGANTAGLAVDGEKGTSVPGNQCTLTNPEDGPWWQVDLGRNYPIGRVRVLNRGDCCGGRLHGFVVQVKQDGQSWRACGTPYSETPGDGQSITVDCVTPMVARYVRIQLPGKSERLSLCEVEVFTDIGCPTGYIVHGGTCYKPYTAPLRPGRTRLQHANRRAERWPCHDIDISMFSFTRWQFLSTSSAPIGSDCTKTTKRGSGKTGIRSVDINSGEPDIRP
ncbi:uncharacterized protein LOC118429888 isoform X1 [Branchiostoma floridae]|uniref:Uncharacterized protein LOC118429888 isoform X1 n=1 Tax=Branchiostoma floridae TaxID=7739 RepID=A0A9J7NBF0_BRAFL|nr:uncharacterized protein LOC118429888 isoform X1 [Branchiostoma floridae]